MMHSYGAQLSEKPRVLEKKIYVCVYHSEYIILNSIKYNFKLLFKKFGYKQFISIIGGGW